MAAERSQSYDRLSHPYLKKVIDNFFTATNDARALSERCRDYYDGVQWTAEQIKELKRRKQAPIVNNRIKIKLNGLLGLVSIRGGDPKAYPRNAKSDSGSADAATDALRFVADANHLNNTFLSCADNFFCEGYCAANVTLEQNAKGEYDVSVSHIPWDRIFFDPYSMAADFSDAKHLGFGVWMDEDDVRQTFPEAPEDAFTANDISTDNDHFSDGAADWKWSGDDGICRRLLVITHYFLHSGKWMIAIYTGGDFLLEPMESPYKDEFGNPTCPIVIEHAYNRKRFGRYGELVSMLDLQDEINHRRSKALFLLSQRQTFGSRGAIDDVQRAKMELAKADGHLEVKMGEFGKDFGILPTGDMAQGQIDLMLDAKAELDAQSFNPQLAGERGFGDISGVAIQKLQNAGITDTIRLYENLMQFKLNVYRQIWYRIKQGWDSEKWVRITDDQKKLRWVGFNVPITTRDMLQEIMDDEARPYEMRLAASAQMITLEQQAPEMLDQVVEIRNPAAELDVDVTLDEAYNTINASQEQIDAIMKYGAQNAFDIIDLLEISNIQGKDDLIEKIQMRRDEQANATAQQMQQPDANQQYLMAKTAETTANAKVKEVTAIKTEMEAQKIALETAIINEAPQPVTITGSVVL